ncbi:MAG: hypothetical protein HS116_10640 [Planctomycetes bacterium]|nr:hypothetical protein [Planctomycetota bacterium]
MLIIWGSENKETERGWVADYCLNCNEVCPHRVIEMRCVSHIYFISIGKGSLIGFFRICRKCKMTLPTSVEHYSTLLRRPSKELGELISRTHPGLPLQMVLREQAREHLAGGLDNPDERLVTLTDLLIENSLDLETRCASTHIDLYSAMWMLATLGLPIAAFMLCREFAVPGALWPLWGALFTAFACVVMVIVALKGDPSRFARGTVIPTLAPLMKPIRPTQEDIERALKDLKDQRLAVGKKVKAQDLYEAYTLAASS